jgi:hypothetical protein
MSDWRDKLRSIQIAAEKKKVFKPKVAPVIKSKKIPIVHYFMPLVHTPQGSRWSTVTYVLGCTGRPYAEKPKNATDKRRLVTCPQCLRNMR